MPRVECPSVVAETTTAPNSNRQRSRNLATLTEPSSRCCRRRHPKLQLRLPVFRRHSGFWISGLGFGCGGSGLNLGFQWSHVHTCHGCMGLPLRHLNFGKKNKGKLHSSDNSTTSTATTCSTNNKLNRDNSSSTAAIEQTWMTMDIQCHTSSSGINT